VQHLAIDLGGRESQVCLMEEDGEVLRETRVPTLQLEAEFQRPKCRVIVETCAEAFGVADAALRLGHEARVVPATLVRALGVGARRMKSDRRDALALSSASCRMDLPSVHIPSPWSRETKSMCSMRDGLVQSRTMLVNTVRGWMRARRQMLSRGDPKRFPARVRLLLTETETPLPEFVERQLCTIEALNEQVKAADVELGKRAKDHPVCARLMSVPGVGPQTALRFVAAVDEIGRFTNAHDLESYLGLTPGEDSSSARKRITSITKAGAPGLRWVLVEACWVFKRCRPNDPIVLWADKIAQRRGKRIAVVAMARKVVGILYALWRDGTTYDPTRSARIPVE